MYKTFTLFYLKKMFSLQEMTFKASKSSFWMYIFNKALGFVVPFNKPHNFTITKITDTAVTVKLPYQKSNFNHIKGIHACALATVSEYATGLVLMNSLGSKKYRIILAKLNMEYHYQGKTDCFANFEISNDFIKQEILTPLKTKDSVQICCTIKIHDEKENHISTAHVYWQIKSWQKVKTVL